MGADIRRWILNWHYEWHRFWSEGGSEQWGRYLTFQEESEIHFGKGHEFKVAIIYVDKFDLHLNPFNLN